MTDSDNSLASNPYLQEFEEETVNTAVQILSVKRDTISVEEWRAAWGHGTPDTAVPQIDSSHYTPAEASARVAELKPKAERAKRTIRVITGEYRRTGRTTYTLQAVLYKAFITALNYGNLLRQALPLI